MKRILNGKSGMNPLLTLLFFAVVLTSALSAQNSGTPFVQEGIASWYGAEFDGRPTASGETFNSSLFTAAHPALPFGTMLKITNKHNNRSVIVRVNDRGPFVSARIVDVSRAAAQELDMLNTGTAPVLLEVLTANHAVSPNTGPVRPLEQTNPNVPLFSQPAPVYPPMPPSTGQNQAGAAILKGTVSGDNAAKLYRIQVGAYVHPKNAVDAFEKLKNAGLNPAYEKYNEFYRVVLSGIKNTELQSVAEKIGQAGFREAIIREEN